MQTSNYSIILGALLITISTILSSCESTTTPQTTSAKITDTTLFVLSEGQYGKNNSTLDAFSLKSKDTTTSHDIISGLGDTGNDIQFFGRKLYIILEKSNKIVVINPDSITDRVSIPFPSAVTPFKMAQVSSSELWVTEFASKQIGVVNLNSNTLTSSINIDTAQQDIGILAGKAFICTNANKLEVLDIATKQVLSNKYIGDSPAQILIDSLHSSVLVLTFGNYSPKTVAKILWVNPTTYSITDSLIVDSLEYANVLLSSGGKAFAVFPDKVCTLDLATHKLAPFLAKGYYKGIYDNITNMLILGDAKDYSSPGIVDLYDATTGALKRSFNSGIIPGHFVIYRK